MKDVGVPVLKGSGEAVAKKRKLSEADSLNCHKRRHSMERQRKREEGRKREGLPSRKGKRRSKRKWGAFPL